MGKRPIKTSRVSEKDGVKRKDNLQSIRVQRRNKGILI
jgi:hypothetical protein